MEFLKGRDDAAGTESWRLLLTEAQIQSKVKELAAKIKARYIGKPIVLAGIMKGALWFLKDLSTYLDIPCTVYLIEARSYHNAQTQSEELEILSVIHPDKFLGRTVILLDELFDNGVTLNAVKRAIYKKLVAAIMNDPKITDKTKAISEIDIFTCVTFFKKKETTQQKPDLYGFVIPNVWVVGYGLDDCQEKRGWPVLFACPKSEGIPETEDDLLFKSEEKYQEVLAKLRSQ